MGLTDYIKKRSFDSTPEPKGKVRKTATKKLAFVVQKHQASHLHYDFRLELDGVMKSWAVPKGPSLNPTDKRLAVAVEDHPYEYRTFEGTIPADNYGAGEVIIWDSGTYGSAEGGLADLKKGFTKGHIDFVIEGKKLKGRFALIREHDSKNWLLIKKKDEFASMVDITKDEKSVKSGKRVEDLKVPAKKAAAKESAVPEFVSPMLATLVDKPFDDKDWLFELKLDGYRAVGSRRSGLVSLHSRSRQDFSHKYRPIAEALENLPDDTVVDGEIVVVDDDGTPHFNWLQNWGSDKQGNLLYFVFDVMYLLGNDVTGLPLIERKKLLKKLLPDEPSLIFCDHIEADGKSFFKEIAERRMEGIMAKKRNSVYKPGIRSADWLKIKTELRQEVVICGFTEPKGSRKHLGSLILGVYENKKLRYVGHSGGGIPVQQLKSLRERLTAIETSASPFDPAPKLDAGVHWAKPELLCEVSFSEWTPDGMMRHPKFIGLREDKAANLVTAEHAAPTSRAKASGTSIKLTNLDKLFFPEAGITKGDLADYYERIGGRMLPYLFDRPHVLLRHPNGAGTNGFFQKDVNEPPEGLRTVPLHSESTGEDVDYLVVDSADALRYMVQLGCIEINPWHARTASIDNPDWVIMDLDPVDVSYAQVVQVALTIKKLCDEWGIPSYPKTSGKKGMHVYIPTGGLYDSEQIRLFAELMAVRINQREPELTSLERTPSKRKGKVYLDYLRNTKGQTVSAPYSVRPTPQATVSMPLAWEEVTPSLKPTDFTIKNIQERLDLPDPWEKMLQSSFDLAKVIADIS